MAEARAAPRSVGSAEGRREDLVADAAALYYQSRLDQQEIARRMKVSRSTVSRMLSEALDTGIVEIRIRRPLALAEDVQRALVSTFGLRDALVLAAHGPAEALLGRVGALAARYVDGVLTDDDVLAISWGTSLRAVTDALEPRIPRTVEVVQMLGGACSRDPQVDGTELARRLADLLGGRCRYLNAPLVVDSEEVASALLRQRGVRDTLAAAGQADVALVGIGALIPEVSSLLRAGYLSRRGLADIRRTGAVGDVCGHLFTAEGRLVESEFQRRVIAIAAAPLSRIPRVIGVAAGRRKAEAVLGALRCRLVNVLVTDEETACAVLTLAS
ncbi:MAG: sugar-binding transcriptional regulator [Sporichthyaceae bacterium]|nr:sugar-binding transcriptional regulator [Sporichthyaceae bacterium]